jgi:citrate lyase gamma subunit
MNDPTEPDDLRADLAALREVSDRDLPNLNQVMHDIRRRAPERTTPIEGWRRRIMAVAQSMKARPALAALAAVAVLIAVGMVVPVSYDRVTGHDVSVTLAGTSFTPDQIAPVAKEMKARLGAEAVKVEAMEENGAPRFVFQATVPERSRADAARAAGAFVKDLAGKGYIAALAVAPHREHVRSPAVAYALDQIIQISVDGKSASALESEIRQRLAEAGLSDAQVSVQDRPEGGREISVNVQRQNFGGAPQTEPVPELVLTKNGAPITGGSTVKIRKMKDETGATTLVVETSDHGKTATATVPNSEKMSDAELESAIETQLRQAGLNVRVEVVGGQVRVRPIE